MLQQDPGGTGAETAAPSPAAKSKVLWTKQFILRGLWQVRTVVCINSSSPFTWILSWIRCPKMTSSNFARSRWLPCRRWRADAQVVRCDRLCLKMMKKGSVCELTFLTSCSFVMIFDQTWKKKLNPSNSLEALRAVQMTPRSYRFVFARRRVSSHPGFQYLHKLNVPNFPTVFLVWNVEGVDWAHGCLTAAEGRNSAKSCNDL